MTQRSSLSAPQHLLKVGPRIHRVARGPSAPRWALCTHVLIMHSFIHSAHTDGAPSIPQALSRALGNEMPVSYYLTLSTHHKRPLRVSSEGGSGALLDLY